MNLTIKRLLSKGRAILDFWDRDRKFFSDSICNVVRKTSDALFSFVL